MILYDQQLQALGGPFVGDQILGVILLRNVERVHGPERADLQGDVHMHTVETDGRNTIEEMAEAARERGYEYMAITDHSQSLTIARGLTVETRLASSRIRIRKRRGGRSRSGVASG